MRARWATAMVAISMFVTGCVSSVPTSPPEPKTENPDDVVHRYLTAMQKSDFEAAATYRAEGARRILFGLPIHFIEPENRVLQVYLSKLQFTIHQVVEHADDAVVDVTVSIPDMDRVMVTAHADLVSLVVSSSATRDRKSDDYVRILVEEKVIEVLSRPNLSMVTRTGTAELKRVDGDWEIVATKAIYFPSSSTWSE